MRHRAASWSRHVNAKHHPGVLARYINDNLVGPRAERHNVKFVKLPKETPPKVREHSASVQCTCDRENGLPELPHFRLVCEAQLPPSGLDQTLAPAAHVAPRCSQAFGLLCTV